MVGRPTFMTRFPGEMEAFNMKRVPEDRTKTGSVDLLIPGVGEIVGRSMRVDDYDELIGACRTSSTRRRTTGSRTSASTGRARTAGTGSGRSALSYGSRAMTIPATLASTRYIDRCERSFSFSRKTTFKRLSVDTCSKGQPQQDVHTNQPT